MISVMPHKCHARLLHAPPPQISDMRGTVRTCSTNKYAFCMDFTTISWQKRGTACQTGWPCILQPSNPPRGPPKAAPSAPFQGRAAGCRAIQSGMQCLFPARKWWQNRQKLHKKMKK